MVKKWGSGGWEQKNFAPYSILARYGTEFFHGDPNTLWANGCDFGGNDIDRVSVPPELCGQVILTGVSKTQSVQSVYAASN